MQRTKSGWYYVGHGQLRFMDADGWTEQYRNIDNPAPAAVPAVASSQVVASSGPPALPHDPQERSARSATWFVAAAVAAVTSFLLSASGADLPGVDDPADVRPPAPRAQTPSPEEVPESASVPVRPTSGEAATPSISPLAFEGRFSQQRALAKAFDVIGDLRVVDDCLSDGVDVRSALILLSRSYGRLAEAGVPPGLGRSDYLGRVGALQVQSAQAAEGYDVDRTAALAKYAAVREGTRVLFQQINGALGSHLALP
jgi:hypothetical protein